MVAVLDQFEVEYKETYTSGTYDQVVMGRMFATVVGSSGKDYSSQAQLIAALFTGL